MINLAKAHLQLFKINLGLELIQILLLFRYCYHSDIVIIQILLSFRYCSHSDIVIIQIMWSVSSPIVITIKRRIINFWIIKSTQIFFRTAPESDEEWSSEEEDDKGCECYSCIRKMNAWLNENVNARKGNKAKSTSFLVT